MTKQQSGALQRQTQLKTLQSELERTASVWKTSVPETMTRILSPERVTKIVLLAASKQGSAILKCTTKSVIRSVADAVSLGLEPGGPLGHAYLVPFKNRDTRQLECQLIVGYRGLVALARRSGQIVSVEAHAYYANDTAKVVLGTDSRIEHEPCMEGERGALKGVYCIARFVGGGSHMDFMSKADVDRIRAMAPGKDSPAWKNHYDEMAKKTVVRRAAKYWPLSADLSEALARQDDTAAPGDGQGAEVIDMSFEEDDEDEQAPAQALPEGAQPDAEAPAARNEDGQPTVGDYQQRVQKMLEKE